MACVKGLPVDRTACAPELAKRPQRMIELSRLTARVWQRRERRRSGGARTVLPRECLERAARPHFEQHQRSLVQKPHAFREANGLAQLAGPIGGIDCLRTRDLRPREAGYPRLAG